MDKIFSIENRYLPIIIFAVSLFPVFISLNYRKNDWATGALLLLYIFLPILFLQFISLSGFYLTKNHSLRKIAVLTEVVLLLVSVILTLIYIFKYN
jgi:hypothetical protein